MPADPYFVDVAVRWSDMDAYGHVNNVAFVRLLEDARVYALRDWFGHDRDLIEDALLVVRQEIDYLAPLTFDYRPARITMGCSRISGASFDIGYAVGQPERDVTYAIAEVTLVAYDLQRSTPRRLTETERAQLSSIAAEPAPLRSRATRTSR